VFAPATLEIVSFAATGVLACAVPSVPETVSFARFFI
jgi:hypothetical protein